MSIQTDNYSSSQAFLYRLDEVIPMKFDCGGYTDHSGTG